jgi:hypothetical protein
MPPLWLTGHCPVDSRCTRCRSASSQPQRWSGQRLGIREVDEGIWLVSFMHYDLGFIDLE